MAREALMTELIETYRKVRARARWLETNGADPRHEEREKIFLTKCADLGHLLDAYFQAVPDADPSCVFFVIRTACGERATDPTAELAARAEEAR